MMADRIDIIRVRLFTTLDHVRADLALREASLGPRYAKLYVSPVTKFWHHDWHGLDYTHAASPTDPRGEPIIEVPNWRDVLDAAERNPSMFGEAGLAAFVAAHGDNCMHAFLPRSWSAYGWKAYAHALRRNPDFGRKLETFGKGAA